MVSTYWERHQAFSAAVQAAREALDAAERIEEAYWTLASRAHDPKPYIMDEREKHLRSQKERAIEELEEAIFHVRDAISAWWPNRPAAA